MTKKTPDATSPKSNKEDHFDDMTEDFLSSTFNPIVAKLPFRRSAFSFPDAIRVPGISARGSANVEHRQVTSVILELCVYPVIYFLWKGWRLRNAESA